MRIFGWVITREGREDKTAPEGFWEAKAKEYLNSLQTLTNNKTVFELDADEYRNKCTHLEEEKHELEKKITLLKKEAMENALYKMQWLQFKYEIDEMRDKIEMYKS